MPQLRVALLLLALLLASAAAESAVAGKSSENVPARSSQRPGHRFS
ncbi:hypothetical protein Anapl_08932 [Anas platyrhynchos]|uniref:Uncharacterized protein n=1 Tax=Anas platyrhynchos TaxID=8839 RepID=R0JLC0_ANAPL|nr:hypothetical protein Anapl_08932 [Anas platyrhynchos]